MSLLSPPHSTCVKRHPRLHFPGCERRHGGCIHHTQRMSPPRTPLVSCLLEVRCICMVHAWKQCGVEHAWLRLTTRLRPDLPYLDWMQHEAQTRAGARHDSTFVVAWPAWRDVVHRTPNAIGWNLEACHGSVFPTDVCQVYRMSN